MIPDIRYGVFDVLGLVFMGKLSVIPVARCFVGVGVARVFYLCSPQNFLKIYMHVVVAVI
jgi:hypothetical protein